MVLNKKIILLFILFIFHNLNKIYAEDKTFFKKNKYCYENNLGWKFYCDEEIKNEEQEKQQKPEQNKNGQNKTYLEKLSELQKEVEEAKAKAVLEPSEENLKNYMYIQQRVVDRASYFSDVWRRVLWATPELDYTQKRPVSNAGKNVWEKDRENKIFNVLKNINKRYGIFFIYSTTCGFCQKYSQILYDLKQQYSLEIKGISIDGRFLPNWENNSFINKGQLEQLKVDYSTVPITILYDNLTNLIVPIGYGLMTQDEIKQRIYVLTQTKIGEDY